MHTLIDAAPVLTDSLDDASREHFDRLRRLLTDVDVDFTVNPRLVRGLDYYTRTVFEWVTDRLGAQSAICSGGRYDGLIAELGGRETPAVGWALGIERVVELMRADGQAPAERLPHLGLVAVGEQARRKGFMLAEQLRQKLPGLRVMLCQSGSGLKAQLKRADKSGARFALILGDDELATGRASLKDLREDRGQQSLTDSELESALASVLEPLD
jgi:histidyl-tRNA synthetase